MKNPFKNMFPPPEYKIELRTEALAHNLFLVNVYVYYGRHLDYTDWERCIPDGLDDAKAGLISQARQYIENAKGNSTEVIDP